MMAGLLGPLALASYSIALNLTALIFMLALGFGAATAVRVGAARGAGDHQGMVVAGWVGLAATVTIMAGFGVLLYLLREPLAMLYSDDATLRVVLPGLILIVAFILVPDGGQVVMSFGLRGAGDAWTPTALHLLSFFVVMIPGAWLLAFPVGLGTVGLMAAIAMGAGTSLVILSLRFWLVTRRP
jgi:MATE family multidrug resistance protein